MAYNNTKLGRTLRHRVEFLSNNKIDELQPDNWEIAETTYAEISPICDNRFMSIEGIEFGHVITEALFMFRIRFIRGLSTKMRIRFSERLFEIKRIINIHEQSRVLKIIALEIL